MNDQQWFAERFAEQRQRLHSVAYRMLGSRTEADDALQEAWIRTTRSDSSVITNINGRLTTVVGRVCVDMLRACDARPETPTGTLRPNRRSPASRPTLNRGRSSPTQSAWPCSS